MLPGYICRQAYTGNMQGSKVVILDENDIFQGSTHNSGSASLQVSQPELIIDKAAYTVYYRQSRISFPKKEFELLLLLASNPKKVFKREDILLSIWGHDFKPKDSRSLDVHIRMLRKKLGEAFISTVRGVGYKLEK